MHFNYEFILLVHRSDDNDSGNRRALCSFSLRFLYFPRFLSEGLFLLS